MQDRFAIGPVTIVQLVGLSNKPRIVSTHVDTAVRTADPLPPPSAVAGFGIDMDNILSEIEISYFDIKTPASLSITAPTYSGSISFDAAVDRAVADNGPQQAAPQFIALPDNIDLASLLSLLRGETKPTVPADVPPMAGVQPVVGDHPSVVDPTTGPADAPVSIVPVESPTAPTSEITELSATEPDGPDFIFDGAAHFGDDAILDFEAYYADAGLLHSTETTDAAADVLFNAALAEHAGIDLGPDYVIDFADTVSDIIDLDPAHPQPAVDAAIVPL